MKVMRADCQQFNNNQNEQRNFTYKKNQSARSKFKWLNEAQNINSTCTWLFRVILILDFLNKANTL